MNRVAVYTSIFGGKDVLKDPLKYEVDTFIDYYCFTDDPSIKSDIYQVIVKNISFPDITKNARFYKVLGAEELNEYDYIICHDGNIQIDHSKVYDLVQNSSKHFLTTFRHPHRSCFYEEAAVCIRRNKEKPVNILKQVLRYHSLGLPSNSGLFETGIIVKNNSFDATDFYEDWWKHLVKYTVRDQLSLCFLVWRKGVPVGILPGSGTENTFSIYHSHTKRTLAGSKYFKFLLVKLILLIKPDN